MRITPPDISLRKDSRGVSEVVGFLLIFALLIILLSINQAQFVPQENSEVEFQHFQDVQDDMVDVRSAISDAGQNNESQYPTVQLGTNYPTRLFAVNPPPPTGTLQTSQKYNISIYDDPSSDTPTENVSTRFLEYQNGYNELNVGSIWYENSVLYLDERDDNGNGNIVVIEDQNLITGDSASVRVTALQESYSESSAGRVSIELYPAESTDIDLDDFEGEIKIKIPTRLRDDYWDNELGGYDEYDGFVPNPDPDQDVNFFELTVDIESLKLNTVGIDSVPEEQTARQGIDAGIGGGNGGNGGNGGAGSVSADVAFVSSTSGTLKTVGASGTITTYAAGGNIETIGSTVNLDADSATEVTFVDTSGIIKYIDSSDSSPTTLLSSVSVKKDGIAAGTWQGSQVSVFFANNNDEDGLYRKAPDGNRQLVATFPQKLRAVVGIGDIDDDGSDEIAAVTNGQKIAVLDDDGSTYVSGQQPASSSGLAIGGVADYNGDGQERIAIVDGSNNPVLVGCGVNPGGQYKCNSEWGGTTTLSDAGQAKKAPFGKGNIDGDGQPELVYPENINSPAELYGVSVSGDTVSDEAHITRSDGTRIKVVVAKGVSEYVEPLSPSLLRRMLSAG